MKIQKKNVGRGGGVRGVGLGGGGQVGCERRIEVFVKIQKKNCGSGGGVGLGGQGECDRRIEVLGKFHQKQFRGGGGGRFGGGGDSGCGVRVDVNEELKFL